MYFNISDTCTLFMLYFHGNHTLFSEKLYLISKFTSDNTGLMKMGPDLCKIF